MPDNKKMILNLFAGMQDALFLGDRFSNGEFVSFLQPGQFISQNLIESNDSNDMAIQSQIANIIIDSSYVNKYKDINYSGGTELVGSVSQVYSDILNHAALPYQELSAPVLREIESLRVWIMDNRATYELYRDQYYDAIDLYETEAHKQTPDGGKLRRLAKKKSDAATYWDVQGQKKLFEIKYGRYIYLTNEDPSSLWANLAQRLQDNAQQAPKYGPYYQTFLIPSITSWNSSSWATFERTISENDTYDYSKSTSWSAGLSGSWGLWSWGGGTSGSTNYQHNVASAQTVKLKFDYQRVRIFRPWLVDDVFSYKFWTWKKEFGGQFISDGGNLTLDPPIRPIGRMPILPQYLIVVKNVELTANFTDQESTFYHREIQANASIGWGPFSVSGSYNEAETTKTYHSDFDNVTFKIDQPQIIARTGIMLGKTPDPNRALPWQNDACFPGDGCFSEQQKINNSIRNIDYLNCLKEEKLIEINQEADTVKALWIENRSKNL